jgi:hypothetical protein
LGFIRESAAETPPGHASVICLTFHEAKIFSASLSIPAIYNHQRQSAPFLGTLTVNSCQQKDRAGRARAFHASVARPLLPKSQC